MREYAVERYDSTSDTCRYYGGLHPTTLGGRTYDAPVWTHKIGEAVTFQMEDEAHLLANDWGDYYATKGYPYPCHVAIFDDE